MTRLIDFIQRLLPQGSNPWSPQSVAYCPAWPPDLFAIAGSLVERSGCYSEPIFTSAWDRRCVFSGNYAKRVERIAEDWSASMHPPRELQRLWKRLLASGNDSLISESRRTSSWKQIALELLAIADEAAAGIGFDLDSSESDAFRNFPRVVLLEHLKFAQHEVSSRRRKLRGGLPYLPQSLCKMVPDTEVCVQPKTNTPGVGCTLRSYSHHLALLPSRGTVTTSWLFAQDADIGSGGQAPLNLMLVPFPYRMHSNDFIADGFVCDTSDRFFSMSPEWMPPGPPRKQAEQLVEYLLSLAQQAEREIGAVHGIVFPELALTRKCAELLAHKIGKAMPSLELFISGTLDERPNFPRNTAFTCRLLRGNVVKQWHQSKHHRWCLDASQTRRYHLGNALDPEKKWWEKIDVEKRECVFSVIRSGASLAVLVCEDLARFDPVMPALYSVGPNLVIALLMDGPQLQGRWPGRYATVLADDPGSSVLTLSCLGMVRRSSMPGAAESRQVALWKQPGGEASELQLPLGHHALLLTLTSKNSKQFTMDMRSDHEASQFFSLSAAHSLQLNRRDIPNWLELD